MEGLPVFQHGILPASPRLSDSLRGMAGIALDLGHKATTPLVASTLANKPAASLHTSDLGHTAVAILITSNFGHTSVVSPYIPILGHASEHVTVALTLTHFIATSHFYFLGGIW